MFGTAMILQCEELRRDRINKCVCVYIYIYVSECIYIIYICHSRYINWESIVVWRGKSRTIFSLSSTPLGNPEPAIERRNKQLHPSLQSILCRSQISENDISFSESYYRPFYNSFTYLPFYSFGSSSPALDQRYSLSIHIIPRRHCFLDSVCSLIIVDSLENWWMCNLLGYVCLFRFVVALDLSSSVLRQYVNTQNSLFEIPFRFVSLYKRKCVALCWRMP